MITSAARPERTGQGSGSRVRGGTRRPPLQSTPRPGQKRAAGRLVQVGPSRADRRQQLGAHIQGAPGQISPIKEVEQRLLDVGDRHERERGAVAEVVELLQPRRVVRLCEGSHRLRLEEGGTTTRQRQVTLSKLETPLLDVQQGTGRGPRSGSSNASATAGEPANRRTAGRPLHPPTRSTNVHAPGGSLRANLVGPRQHWEHDRGGVREQREHGHASGQSSRSRG